MFGVHLANKFSFRSPQRMDANYSRPGECRTVIDSAVFAGFSKFPMETISNLKLSLIGKKEASERSWMSLEPKQAETQTSVANITSDCKSMTKS